jgi:hypothetical protein
MDYGKLLAGVLSDLLIEWGLFVVLNALPCISTIVVFGII